MHSNKFSVPNPVPPLSEGPRMPAKVFEGEPKQVGDLVEKPKDPMWVPIYGMPADVSTKLPRPNVPALDKLLGVTFRVHDHGRVRCIDYMGDDAAIVQAARVSYGKGTKTKSKDAGLISYLIENYHTSPIEQARIKFHIKAPIFVARQWIRTRMSSTNEYSGRYSEMTCEYYVPADEDIAAQSTDNKQGRGEVLTPEQRQKVRDLLIHTSEDGVTTYNKLLDDEVGLARELARIGLSLNTYTEWYWTIDAHNLFNFIRLRFHPHAQKEIRDYAEVIWKLVKIWLPMTADAVENFILEGERFSGAAMRYLAARIAAHGAPVPAPRKMSRREKTRIDALFPEYKEPFLVRAVNTVLTIFQKA